MTKLPDNIEGILNKEALKIIDITHLLTFYKENKKQLTARQKLVIYRRVEQIRTYYNTERIEQKQLVRNDDSIQTINYVHKSIELNIEDIRPNDLYTDDFRRVSILEHYINKFLAFYKILLTKQQKLVGYINRNKLEVPLT